MIPSARLSPELERMLEKSAAKVLEAICETTKEDVRGRGIFDEPAPEADMGRRFFFADSCRVGFKPGLRS